VEVGPQEPPGFDAALFYPEALVPAALRSPAREEVVRALRRVESLIHNSVKDEKRNTILRRRLAAALADTGATVWVASNDKLALSCLDVLAQRKVRVPGTLSVVGFDDVPEALFGGLTSYCFNPRGVARKLLDIVLTSPALLKREGSQEPVEVPGFISERRSCGAPRGAPRTINTKHATPMVQGGEESSGSVR
jgi:DNA-binding LacI/PurR family transcriptional regulator